MGRNRLIFRLQIAVCNIHGIPRGGRVRLVDRAGPAVWNLCENKLGWPSPSLFKASSTSISFFFKSLQFALQALFFGTPFSRICRAPVRIFSFTELCSARCFQPSRFLRHQTLLQCNRRRTQNACATACLQVPCKKALPSFRKNKASTPTNAMWERAGSTCLPAGPCH